MLHLLASPFVTARLVLRMACPIQSSSHSTGDDLSQGKQPACSSQFSIGGVSVRVFGERDSDVAFNSLLELFRADAGRCHVDLRVRWVDRIAPTPQRALFDSGSIWRLHKRGDALQFDFSTSNLGAAPYKRLLIDTAFRSGTLQMNRESIATRGTLADPFDYPLDELLIMHRLTQEKAIELHGTGIVRPNGEANLFVGHSGAGKSTTTRLWTSIEDVEVLSDDRIIVRRDEGEIASHRDGSGTEDQVGVLRLRDPSALPTGRSAQDDNKKKMRMYGTPWHGEAMYASPNSAPLSRIFVLEHGHGNVITPLTPSQAVAELFARSFVPFHRHEYVESALTFLEEVVASVPVYRYSFEPDQRAVEQIIHFHD